MMFQNILSLILTNALASLESLLRHRNTNRVTSVATMATPTRMKIKNRVNKMVLSFDFGIFNNGSTLFIIFSFGKNSPLAMNETMSTNFYVFAGNDKLVQYLK